MAVCDMAGISGTIYSTISPPPKDLTEIFVKMTKIIIGLDISKFKL